MNITTSQKTILFNIINNVKNVFQLNFASFLIKKKNISTMEVTFLSLVTLQEVVPLLANKK